jgi:hypothetical protein
VLVAGEEIDAIRRAPAGHSAPSLVVDCVSYHEYVELHNGGHTPISLNTWRLEDALGHTFPLCAASIAPGEFLLCTGNFSLNNGGDTLRLMGGQGNVVDESSYPGTAYDVSWSRTVDVRIGLASEPV